MALWLDMTPSAANGAVVELLRTLQCIQGFSGPGHRAWRVTGVAIWPVPHRAQRPASRSVRQAGLVHAQREGNKACDPRSRERAAVVITAGTAGLTVLCVRDGRPSGARRRPQTGGATRSATTRTDSFRYRQVKTGPPIFVLPGQGPWVSLSSKASPCAASLWYCLKRSPATARNTAA